MPMHCPEDNRNGGAPLSAAEGCPLRPEWDEMRGAVSAELSEIRRDVDMRLAQVAGEVAGEVRCTVQETLGHFSETLVT